MRGFINSWQADYEAATGKHGRVVEVFGKLGRFGGLAIWVEVEENGETRYFSPYLNSSPGDGEHRELDIDRAGKWRDPETGRYTEPCYCDLCSFELDENAWLDSMTGATDWGTWDWGKGEEDILDH